MGLDCDCTYSVFVSAKPKNVRNQESLKMK